MVTEKRNFYNKYPYFDWMIKTCEENPGINTSIQSNPATEKILIS